MLTATGQLLSHSQSFSRDQSQSFSRDSESPRRLSTVEEEALLFSDAREVQIHSVPEQDVVPRVGPELWAHRGMPAIRAENTLPSFEMAMEEGADGIYAEVHITEDFVPVVIADSAVDRTTNGTGMVSSLSLIALRSLNAANCRFNLRHAIVPTLAELLTEVLGRPWGQRNRKVMLELAGPSSGLPALAKTMHDLFAQERPHLQDLPQCVAAVLQPYADAVKQGRIIVASYCKPYLEEMKQIFPFMQVVYCSHGSRRGWLEDEDMQNDMVADGVCAKFSHLTEELVVRLRAHHQMVLASGLRREEDFVKASKLGIDGIVTLRSDIAMMVKSGCTERRDSAASMSFGEPMSAREPLSARSVMSFLDGESQQRGAYTQCCVKREGSA